MHNYDVIVYLNMQNTHFRQHMHMYVHVDLSAISEATLHTKLTLLQIVVCTSVALSHIAQLAFFLTRHKPNGLHM